MGLSLCPTHALERKIPPVQERACAVAGQQQEKRDSNVGDDIEGQEDDEFEDLAEIEWCVDGMVAWWTETLDGCFEFGWRLGRAVFVFVIVCVMIHRIVRIGGSGDVAIMLRRDVARGLDEAFETFAYENLSFSGYFLIHHPREQSNPLLSGTVIRDLNKTYLMGW